MLAISMSVRKSDNPELYAKVEEHFIDGTNLNIDHALNLLGVMPTSKLTVFKLGVSF